LQEIAAAKQLVFFASQSFGGLNLILISIANSYLYLFIN